MMALRSIGRLVGSPVEAIVDVVPSSADFKANRVRLENTLAGPS